MSACVKWAKEQVDAFNIILARQLSSAEHGGKVWLECMEQAKEHAGMLSAVGVDFRGLVGLQDGPKEAVPARVIGLGIS